MVKKQDAGDVMSMFLNESAKQSSPDATAQATTNTGAGAIPINKKEVKSVHMQILITPRLKTGLQGMAAETGYSMNELVNMAIEKLIKGE